MRNYGKTFTAMTRAAFFSGSICGAAFFLCPGPCPADEPLKAATPMIDLAPQVPFNKPDESASTKKFSLQGGVSLETQQLPEPDPKAAVFPDAPLYRLGGEESRRKWTPEKFRALNYGVLGISATKKFNGGSYIITYLHPGCPAILAGLKVGDEELQVNDHVFTRQDDPGVFWRVSAGKAGSAATIIVRRDGQILTFNLTRMNIEDIQDFAIRHMYERQLSFLGAPQE